MNSMRRLFGAGTPAPAPASTPAPESTVTESTSISSNAPTPAPVHESTIPSTDPTSTDNLPESGKEENKAKVDETNTTNDQNSIASTPPKDDKSQSSYTSRMSRFFGVSKKDAPPSPSDNATTQSVKDVSGSTSTPDNTPVDHVEKKDTIDPKKDTIDPKNDTIDPKNDKTEPKKDTIDPKNDTTEPNIDTTEPKKDKTENKKDAKESKKDDNETDSKKNNTESKNDAKDTNMTKPKKRVNRTEPKNDVNLSAGGGSSRDNKSSSKSTTPSNSSNNLQELEKDSVKLNNTPPNSTDGEADKDKASNEKINPSISSNLSPLGTEQNKLDSANADQKKPLAPIKKNEKKIESITDTAPVNTSIQPNIDGAPVKPEKKTPTEKKQQKEDDASDPDSIKKDKALSEATKSDQSSIANSTDTEKSKPVVSKDLSKELSEVANEKEKAEKQKPVRQAKNEITIVKGDIVDIKNVEKAREVIHNELLRIQGSINAVHDKAIPIFTSFDNQVNGSITGKVSSSEYAQVISVLTDGKDEEKLFTDACVTVYKNFCGVHDMLDYNAWLAAMGFERSDEELYITLASSLSGLIGTDNRSQSKIENFFNTNIGQTPSPTDSLNRFIDAVSALGLNFTKREITRLHSKLSGSSIGLPQSTILKTISDNNNDTTFDEKCLSFLKRSTLYVEDNGTTNKTKEKDNSNSKEEKKKLKYGLRSGSDIERALHRTIKEKFLNPIEIIQSIILSAYPDMNPNDQTFQTVISIPKQNIAIAIRDIGDNITDGEMQRLLLYLNKGKGISEEDMKAALDLSTLSALFRVPAAESLVIKKLVISLKNENSIVPTAADSASPSIKRKVTCELAATTGANTLAWNSQLTSQESTSDSWTWELDQIDSVPCTIKGSNIIFKIREEEVDSHNDNTNTSSNIVDSHNDNTNTSSNIAEEDKVTQQSNPEDDSSQKSNPEESPKIVKKMAAGNISIPLDALKEFSLVPSSTTENIKFVKVPLFDAENNQIGDVKFTFTLQRDSSLEDMARAHKKEIEKAEAERSVKNDPVVLISNYISDIITALLTNIKISEPEVVDARPRLRRNRRMLAQQEGNLGGRKVLTDIQAVTKVQALWRGKRIRKRRRRQYIAIREIQRFIRGKLQRMRFKRQVQRYKRLESSEAERLERLRRIRAQERELVLLQGITGSDYIGFERLRKNSSVKVIQRYWRKKQSKNPLSASPRHTVAGDESKVNSEELKIQREQARLLDTIHQVHGNQVQSKRTVHSREIDPLGLAQLQRSIRDTAQNNSKMREKSRFNPMSATRVFDAKAGERPDPSKKGPRRRYQELAEIQQKASILLDDYLMKKPIHQHHSKDRLASLSNCKALAEDLNKLPNLEEARELIKNKKHSVAQTPLQEANKGKKPNLAINTTHDDVNDWFDGISHNDMESSVLTHLKGMHALRSYEWGLVIAPHDVTGPPINIKELSKINDNVLHGDATKLFPSPAAAWVSGKDSEESLMWIAYAAQPSKFGTKVTEADADAAPKSPNAEDEKSHKAARAILGDVNGEDLLGKLAKEVSSVQTRRESIRKKVDSERKREHQLAEIFENEALSLIRQNMVLNANRNLSDIDKRRREDATTKIQSLYRGQRDRKKVSVLNGEKRVVAALQVLLSELQKEGKSAVQMDAASLYKLTFGRQSSSINSTILSKKSKITNDKAKNVTSFKSVGPSSSSSSSLSGKKVLSEKKNVSYDLKPTLSFVDDISETEYTIASPKTPLSARDSNIPRNHIPSGNQLKRSTDDMGSLTPMSDRLNEVSMMSQSQYSPLRGDGYISSPSQSGTLESFSPYPQEAGVGAHSFPMSPSPKYEVQAKSNISPRLRRDSKL